MEAIILTKAQATLKEIIRRATNDIEFANKIRNTVMTEAYCDSALYKVLSEYFMLTSEDLTKLDLTSAEKNTWNDLRTRTPTITQVAMLAELKVWSVEDVPEVAGALSATAAEKTGSKPSPSHRRPKPRRKTKPSRK